MWKFINSLIILLTISFGVVQSMTFGHLMDTPWEFWDFVYAPFVFFAMFLLSTYINKKWFSSTVWAVPSFNTNLLSTKNPLNIGFSLGGLFIALGVGVGSYDLFVGREINDISIMPISMGFGVFCSGFVSVKLFSESS